MKSERKAPSSAGAPAEGGEPKAKEPKYYRAPLPYLFEKELINKQNRHIHIMDKFSASKNVYPIQDKFYSKYTKCPPECIHLGMDSRKDNERIRFPFLESQVYGWLPEQLNARQTAHVNYVNAAKIRCDMTIYGEKLISERVTERPWFGGLRFFLR